MQAKRGISMDNRNHVQKILPLPKITKMILSISVALITGNLVSIGANATNKENIDQPAISSLNTLVNNTVPTISDEGEAAIEHISDITTPDDYLYNYGITEEELTKYLTPEEETLIHTNHSLYNSENNTIDWEKTAQKIYQNSLEAVGNNPQYETLSYDEIRTQMKYWEKELETIQADYPDYDVAKLACKLEDYIMVKGKDGNNTTLAITTKDSTIFYPIDGTYEQSLSESNSEHEFYHLMTTNGCIDTIAEDGLRSTIPNFIREIYAEKYAGEISGMGQQTYLTYDEALNFLQAALALGHDYQIDDLLDHITLEDMKGFLDEFPTYGYHNKEFYLDTLKALNGMSILLDSSQVEQYSSLNPYTNITLDAIRRSTYGQLSKIYFNNLILLNEENSELTLEDNLAFLDLHSSLLSRIKIDRDGIESIIETDNHPSEPYIEIRLEFINYLAQKYNTTQMDIIDQTLNYSPREDYQFPSCLGEEKQQFFKYLYETLDQDVKTPDARQLIK